MGKKKGADRSKDEYAGAETLDMRQLRADPMTDIPDFSPEEFEQFDRRQLLGVGDKATAKTWAKRLRLASWTYVRI